MKRKILSIFLTLVLLCSFSLVTAVPAGALGAPIGDPFFTTNQLGTAEWSTEQKTAGEYSVKLWIPPYDSERLYDEARIVFNYEGDLVSITGVSYPSYVIGGGTSYPFVVLAVDSTGDEAVDSWVVQADPYDPFENDWRVISFDDSSLVHVAGARTGLPGEFTSDTLDALKAVWGNVTVLEVKVMIGELTGLTEAMTAYVDDITINGDPYDLEWTHVSPIRVDDDRVQFPDAPFQTIQGAVDAADPDDTITVAAGEYAGAIVNEDLNIIGAAGGTSVITSGVPYKIGSGLTTGFRLDAGANGAEIRNFTINGDYANSFYFAVFARNADSVIVDSLTVDTMRQGITSWGGSGWQITNNVLNNTFPQTEGSPTGGGIAIYLGGDPTDFPHCDNNLVQGNTIATSAEQSESFTGAAICLWFDEREGFGGYVEPTDQSVTGNEIIDNFITATGLENQVGISIGVGGLEGDENPDKVAACLGVIHDNTVQNNTIDNAEWGLYLYVTTNLTVQGNTVKNCSDCGIYMKDNHANCLINNNSIYGNTNYGLNNTDGATYITTVDATSNWWGDADGPTHTTNLLGDGDTVSDFVDFAAFLTQAPSWVKMTARGQAATAPAVATSDATAVAFTLSTLNGNLTNMGTADSVDVSFGWDITSHSGDPSAYPNWTIPETKSGAGPFSAALTSLTPSETYFFVARAKGNDVAAPVYGVEEKSFTTAAITTSAATNVGAYTATLNGSVELGDADSVDVSFNWGTDPTLAAGANTASITMDASGDFSAELTGLDLGATYYFQTKGEIGGDTRFGDILSFVTVQRLGISVSPTSIDFGNIIAGHSSTSKPVTVTNEGDASQIFTTSLEDELPANFYTLNLKIDGLKPGTGAEGYWITLEVPSPGFVTPGLVLSIPMGALPEAKTATLIFWAEAY